MFQRFKVIIIVLLLFSAFVAIPSSHVWAASPKEEACAGVSAAGGSCTDSGDVNRVINIVVNMLSAIVGIVAVIMVIIGGFKYVTSNGDSNSIQSAKNTIVYAIVGVIIAALAQVIVRFVLKKATNV